MKPFEKTKDGVTNSLLRAYASGRNNPSQTCPEFDPDLANAYIELQLPSGARTRYEHHLSECGACRKSVVALVRLAGTPASLSPAREKERTTWLAGVRKVFGAMSRPQWAMATAAALVLAISLPVLMSRENDRPSQKIAAPDTATEKAPVDTLAGNQQAPEGFAANLKSPGADPSPAAAPAKRRETETEAAGSPARAQNDVVPSVVAGAVDQIKKSEAKSTSSTAEESQRKTQSELAQAPAQPGPPSSQVAKKVDSEDSREQRPEKDSAKQAPESKPGRVDEPSDKERNARVAQIAPPPAPAASSEVGRSGGGLRRAPKLSLRDSAGSGDSVRSNVRKVNKRDFFFRENTWTDKEFDPNKDLPVVTLIRDSNVYKELLSKRAGLKVYLDAFGENERAIIVYKGTVYKLIPQK